MSIKVIDIIKQQNDLDFPVVDANDLLGGFYQVKNIEQRDSIPEERKRIGMICYTEDTDSYYKLGKGGWTDFEIEGSSKEGVNGSAFITNVHPQNTNDHIQVFFQNQTPSYIETDTDLIEIEVMAAIGNTHYKPNVYILDKKVELSQLEAGIFVGTIDVDLEGREELTVSHEDGASHTIDIIHKEAPNILSAIFVGDYPDGQTELKENDTFELEIESDQKIVEIEVDGFEACKHMVKEVEADYSHQIEVAIADRGEEAVLRPARLRVKNESGSYSEWYQTDSDGQENGLNVLMCNNLHPTLQMDIIYPEGQQALKEGETAYIETMANDFDEIFYTSDQLEIEEPDVFESSKEVVAKNIDKNLNSNNLYIEVKRHANGATRTFSNMVKITNTPPTINVLTEHDRLRSSPAGRLHLITIESDQPLLEPPVLVAPHGTIYEDFVNTDHHIWTNHITIYDDDLKGTFEWMGLEAKGLSGLTTTIVEDTYTIGGFATRRIYFDPFERMAPIGTVVTDVSKLACTDIGGYVFEYQDSKEPAGKTFTIVNEDGSLNSSGDYIYICDVEWVEMNSTGDAYVELQELV